MTISSTLLAKSLGLGLSRCIDSSIILIITRKKRRLVIVFGVGDS
jgi:hypothetical protein